MSDGIERDELFGSGVELFAANVFGGVDDLALQVAGVDHIEVHQTEGADAGRGEIESERRAKAPGADAKNLRGFEALLAFHAHFRQDEVPRIAGEIVCGEFGQRNGFGDRRHKSRSRFVVLDFRIAAGTLTVPRQWRE